MEAGKIVQIAGIVEELAVGEDTGLDPEAIRGLAAGGNWLATVAGLSAGRDTQNCCMSSYLRVMPDTITPTPF